MTRADAPRVCVIGGGITGLTTAYVLSRARPDLAVSVLEARDRPGGNVVTERIDGMLVDGGPDSFVVTKPHARDLCDELGIGEDLISTRTTARGVYVVRNGRLDRLPEGMALGVPTRLWPLLSSSVVGAGGKLRAAREPLVKPRTDGVDETIQEFFERRLGREVANVVAGPLLAGIYAGDPRRLSIRATFPELVRMEHDHGSLTRGLLARARAEEASSPPSPFRSFPGGMTTLVAALVRALPVGTLCLGARVTQVAEVEGYGGRYLVDVEGRGPLVASAVVVASPAHVAARLFAESALTRELAAIPHHSTATVFFGFDEDAVAHSLDGAGFIAAHDESRLLACTWVSSKWEGRAPEGRVLLRAFLGGARAPTLVRDSSDDELVRLAKVELTRLLGALGEPRFTRVYRYLDANPQPVVGHGARLERIRNLAGRTRGLYFAGAAYDGVGIPDCVRQAREVAAKVVAQLDRD